MQGGVVQPRDSLRGGLHDGGDLLGGCAVADLVVDHPLPSGGFSVDPRGLPGEQIFGNLPDAAQEIVDRLDVDIVPGGVFLKRKSGEVVLHDPPPVRLEDVHDIGDEAIWWHCFVDHILVGDAVCFAIVIGHADGHDRGEGPSGLHMFVAFFPKIVFVA